MEPTTFGPVQEYIDKVRDHYIINYDSYKDTTPYETRNLYSDAISAKINSLKNKIESMETYMPDMNTSRRANAEDISNNRFKLFELRNTIDALPNSDVYRQKEVDTLRGRIDNSVLVNESRGFVYILYIFITLIIIGGLISMYWFPSNGKLNIFISVIAVLLLLLTFYQ